MVRVLTLYFTRDETTFNFKSLKSVLLQEGVLQDIYVISAYPIRLEKYGLTLPNIVIPTKSSWPVPIRVGYSFNKALSLIRDKLKGTHYQYIFKVDGDAIIPRDYLLNLISRKPLVAGFGPALLISMTFFRGLLKSIYPINYCDDGYILTLAISRGIWPISYNGKDSVKIPTVKTSMDREYVYGIEYYKWGLPIILLLLLPLSRIYLRITRRIRPHQQKEIKAYLYNTVGYLHALLHKNAKYYFYREYGRMRVRHLYNSLFSLTLYRQ